MNAFLDKFYRASPAIIQDIAVSIFDLQYLKRRGGIYKKMKHWYGQLYSAEYEVHLNQQERRLRDFLAFVNEHSTYYRKLWQGHDISAINNPRDLTQLPVMTKEDIRINISRITTTHNEDRYIGHSGGTTGKSLEVFFKWSDMQERMAILDSFRERFGFVFGMRTAWFSGKTLLGNSDEKRRVFWKTDRLFNIRYYSTFHITSNNLPYYIENLNVYRPLYLSGFVSCIADVASYIVKNNIRLAFKPNAVFTTAETVLPWQREAIFAAFGAHVYDQYSSSEGAPWIVECSSGKYHFIMESGIVEVVDESGNPASEGEMIVTSFSTKGTPVVRYKIGDRIAWSAHEPGFRCACGSTYPIVDRLDGRITDFLYSRERGKINPVNVANALKYARGVKAFQAIQESVGLIKLLLVVDKDTYGSNDEYLILKEFKDRLGESMKFEVEYVDGIAREQSGKFRIIKNNIPPDQINL